MSDLDLLGDLLGAARAAGADAADAVLIGSQSVSVQRRLGRTEHVERAESRDLGLRVFLGPNTAIVSASTVDPSAFRALAERAVAMARVVPPDPLAGLAAEMAPPEAVELELADVGEPDVGALTERAAEAEEAALAVAGVNNSEGAEAGFRRSAIALATSAGFSGAYQRTGHSVSATALAGSGTGMQRDYDYHSATHLEDLEAASRIGRSAGERAVARLDPRRPATGRVPVVFDPRVAGSLLGHLSGAINGASVARGTSFLKDAMGTRLFGEGVTIRDDPRRKRGPRSRGFDAEGVPTAPRDLVADGVLQTWLLDSRSARQLGLRATGHAQRGTGGPPSAGASNLFLLPGSVTPAELMEDIAEGLYVVELIGHGVNGVTGDYSRGAAGFMIRGGALAEPVAEITIAGNLREMFAAMVPANDLVFRRGTDSPTVRIDGLTMAGA